MQTQSSTLPSHTVDMQKYNEDMRAGLGSKLFFLEHIPVRDIVEFVDFGCGDGSLLKVLGKMCPEAHLTGVEAHDEQFFLAATNVPTASIHSSLYAASILHCDPACLIFSSVLHEVFTPPQVDPTAWWQGIERYGYEYIVVRDFAVKVDLLRCWSYYNQLIGTLSAQRFFKRYASMPLRDYRKAPFEFLLKYTYTDNWEREVKEHYLRLSYEEWLHMVTASGTYEVIHHADTRTKKFEKDMQRDFGFMPDFTTHIEMVLKRRRR